jgi:hypothetical protein
LAEILRSLYKDTVEPYISADKIARMDIGCKRCLRVSSFSRNQCKIIVDIYCKVGREEERETY